MIWNLWKGVCWWRPELQITPEIVYIMWLQFGEMRDSFLEDEELLRFIRLDVAIMHQHLFSWISSNITILCLHMEIQHRAWLSLDSFWWIRGSQRCTSLEWLEGEVVRIIKVFNFLFPHFLSLLAGSWWKIWRWHLVIFYNNEAFFSC